MDMNDYNMNTALQGAILMQFLNELVGGYDIGDDNNDNNNDRDGEMNEVVSNTTLANYYSSLFTKTLRTQEFIKTFELCFNGDSYICSKHPRPILCEKCLDKYIKNAISLIECSMNDVVVKTYKNVILPRLTDLHDLIVILENESPMGTPLESVLMVMDIDTSPYDPPSKESLEKCEKYTYVKENSKENDGMCTVCQCDMEDGDCARKLMCNDVFHDECIGMWLIDHSTCPNCKFSLK